MFVLESDITIGKFRFSVVNEVHVSKSIHGIADTAVIKVPSIASILEKDRVTRNVVIGKKIKDGDRVVVKLGYNGDMQTEFIGFVKRRNLNMPLEIVCEGYSWLLRRNSITNFWSTITIMELLNVAISGINNEYQINVQCDVDIELCNISIENQSGFDIISNISKYTDGCVSCFFVTPDTLWCGLIYNAYAKGEDVFKKGEVKYRLGYNIVKDNSLEQREKDENPVEVRYTKRLSSGERIFQTSDVFKKFSNTYSKVLNQINGSNALKLLANEKAYQMNYSGYEGTINSFLQPFVQPGYLAHIVDNRYQERNGDYLVESTELEFGVNGARRTIEIGPKVGFANEVYE
jgi:hypothetical protein